MTTLPATWAHLAEVSPQLPVSWYLDPAIFELEKEKMLDVGPGYVGHELLVSEPGSFHVLAWTGDSWMLLRRGEEVELVSNVCRHRQAIMLDGRGHVRNIVCPLHRWSYDLQGRQQAAPHFPENPRLNLDTRPLQNWNGLLFTGPRDVASDLAGFQLASEFDGRGYVYNRTWVEDYPINWKTFIEVYVELLHVEAYHPGLKSLVDCDEFSFSSWELGETWSNQYMHSKPDLSQAATDAYRNYQRLVVDYRGGPPKYGALWFCYYPNVMVEWYPEALIVSQVVAKSPTLTTNVVEFFYPRDVTRERPEIIEAHQASYIETAVEDGAIAERMDRGRAALYERGVENVGPYQQPFETGLVHFHEYVRQRLGLLSPPR